MHHCSCEPTTLIVQISLLLFPVWKVNLCVTIYQLFTWDNRSFCSQNEDSLKKITAWSTSSQRGSRAPGAACSSPTRANQTNCASPSAAIFCKGWWDGACGAKAATLRTQLTWHWQAILFVLIYSYLSYFGCIWDWFYLTLFDAAYSRAT
jgi:hypothetical protein